MDRDNSSSSGLPDSSVKSELSGRGLPMGGGREAGGGGGAAPPSPEKTGPEPEMDMADIADSTSLRSPTFTESRFRSGVVGVATLGPEVGVAMLEPIKLVSLASLGGFTGGRGLRLFPGDLEVPPEVVPLPPETGGPSAGAPSSETFRFL